MQTLVYSCSHSELNPFSSLGCNGCAVLLCSRSLLLCFALYVWLLNVNLLVRYWTYKHIQLFMCYTNRDFRAFWVLYAHWLGGNSVACI